MVNITIPLTGWMAPAELPPLPIGALMVGAAELLQEAADLPQPEYVTISVTERIGLQFGSDRSSFAAITRWALRFGGVLTSDPYHDTDGPQTICSVEFSYFGVQVEAYAFIPAVTAAT
jgi:hypothetical protein